MPVLRMNMSKGPDDTAPGQPGPDIRILENIRAVVVVNEIEVPGGKSGSTDASFANEHE